MRTHPPPQKAKTNEQRGRTEPASPGLVTAKSGRTMTSGASADTRVTPTDSCRICIGALLLYRLYIGAEPLWAFRFLAARQGTRPTKVGLCLLGAGTDKTGLRWSLGLFAVGKGGEELGCVTGKGELGEGRRVSWVCRLGLLSIRHPL